MQCVLPLYISKRLFCSPPISHFESHQLRKFAFGYHLFRNPELRHRHGHKICPRWLVSCSHIFKRQLARSLHCDKPPFPSICFYHKRIISLCYCSSTRLWHTCLIITSR